MSLKSDLEDVRRERIQSLTDEEVMSVYVRKEMYHALSKGSRDFYESGQYHQYMTRAKTDSDGTYGRYLYEEIVSDDLAQQIEDEVHQSGHYESVVSFMFDYLTKDGVTPQDARDNLESVYFDSFGTPMQEIMDAVMGQMRSEVTYTIRKAQSSEHTGKFKLFKGDHRGKYPDKRATRVGNTKEPLWKYLWEKAADQDQDIFVINEEHHEFSGTSSFDAKYISSEKAKNRMN